MEPSPVDRQIDVQGLLTVQLEDAGVDDVAAIERQIGLPSTPVVAGGTPAISLRYSDRLPGATEGYSRVGTGDARWTDLGLALRSSGRRERWVRIPFDDIGGQIVIECERGGGRVPLLIALLNLSMLARGIVPLHASAFVKGGVGIAAAGWSQGGKTEALLAAMADGGTMVADEWAYLTSDRQLFGLPTPVRLEPWHLRARWVDGRAVRADLRHRMRRSALLDRGLALPSKVSGGTTAGRLVGKAVAAIARRNRVDVHPDDLFISRARSLRLDRLYWLVAREGAIGGRRVTMVSRVQSADVARRMAVAHVHHRLDFLDAYWRFRYAFPERRSDLVEEMQARELELLESALEGLPTYRLDHSRHVTPSALALALASTPDY